MEIVSQRGISGIVKYLLDVILAVGTVGVLGLPFGLGRGFQNITWTMGENYWFLLVFLFVTGILGMAMVFELRRMFCRINEHKPFQRQNAVSLKKIALISLFIAAAYTVKIIFYASFLTIVLAVAFLVFGLAGLVFSELFRQAVEVKEENDLTI